MDNMMPGDNTGAEPDDHYEACLGRLDEDPDAACICQEILEGNIENDAERAFNRDW